MAIKLEMPSSKWWASTAVSLIVALAAVIDAADVQGVDLPPWVYLLGAVLTPIAVYLKPERRPSSTARATVLEQSR